MAVPTSMSAELPEEASPMWALYYCVVSFSLLFQAISVLALVRAVVPWSMQKWSRWRAGRRRAPQVVEPVAVVVPCYLPNEAPIIESTIRHLLTKLSYVDFLDLYIVYNTPNDMPTAEAALKELEAESWPVGRRLFVQRVEGSKSKAANLNHVIPQIPLKELIPGLTAKYTVIYDADHHPDPDSLALAVEHLENCGADCVQGSTYIREGRCLPRIIVCAEFFVTYFVMLPMMRYIAGTGFFGGANGIWRTSALTKLRFDTDALCEDIDCFARAMLDQGMTFEFLPECASGELLPSSLRALWKQRLRWAMGWDEVTLKHAAKFWAAPLTLRKRVGLYYIFVCRWFTQFCAVVIILINTACAAERMMASLAAHFLQTDNGDAGDAQLGVLHPRLAQLQLCSFCLYVVIVSYSALRTLFPKPNLELLFGLAVYFFMMPAYVLFGTTLLAVSLVRITSGNTGAWVVTTRAGAAPTQQPLLEVDGVDAQNKKAEGGGSVFTYWVLSVGFVMQGAGVGLLVGVLLGRHEVVHPFLGGWVPWLGLDKRETIIDGATVARGVLSGIAIAILLLVLLVGWQRRKQ